MASFIKSVGAVFQLQLATAHGEKGCQQSLGPPGQRTKNGCLEQEERDKLVTVKDGSCIYVYDKDNKYTVGCLVTLF